MKMRSFRLKAPVFFSQVLYEPLGWASRGEATGAVRNCVSRFRVVARR